MNCLHDIFSSELTLKVAAAATVAPLARPIGAAPFHHPSRGVCYQRRIIHPVGVEAVQIFATVPSYKGPVVFGS